MDESAKNRDFFQDNNTIKENNSKPYTTTQTKSRNFLSNISYVGVTKQDFYNENFIFDVCILPVKNLCPFSLDIKISNPSKHEINLVWKECVPVDFYRHICKEENLMYLNGKTVIYSTVAQIVSKFLKADTKSFALLRDSLFRFHNIFHYVYLVTYPDIYWSTEKCGFDIKSPFYLAFKRYKGKKNYEQAGKNPKNFVAENENAFEQKPITIDELNSDEEKVIKEQSEKKNKKRV